MRLLNCLFAVFAVGADRTARAVKFADEVGYVAIDKGATCWQKCGGKPNWAGHCSFCGLSNGSPGFCCHPDGRGHCSPAMVAALDHSLGHQCVVPNSFTTTNLLQVRQLEHKDDCWSKCGKKRNWSGECGYCGPKGFCCHSDGRGSCPPWISASVQGRRQACMVPSSSRNELLFETEPNSDCYDRRETVCKKLSEVFEDNSKCRQFFSFSECLTGVAEDSQPHCITVVDNICNDITTSMSTAVRETSRHSLRSFGPFEKELFKFLSSAFSGSADSIYRKIQQSDFADSSGSFTAMAEAVTTNSMMDRLAGMNTDRPRVTFALLNALENIWDFNDGRAFSQIEFKLPEDFSLDTFSRDSFDHMLRSNGASVSTQVNMQSEYENIVNEVAEWSLAQDWFLQTIWHCGVGSAQMDLVRLANVKNSANLDFSLMADSLTSVFNTLRLDDDVRDNDLDGLIGVVQNTNSESIIRNGAILAELESLMKDENIWGVSASDKAIERALASRIDGDWYSADTEEFTEEAVADIMQIAAFYSGAQRHVDIKQTAGQVTRNFYSNILDAADRSMAVVHSITGSKKIYKQVAQGFFDNIRASNKISDLVNEVMENRLPSMHPGSAGNTLGQGLLRASILHFDASTTFGVRNLMESTQWSVLDAMLNAVATLDADMSVSDQDLSGAFGCDTSCDFSAIRWNSAPNHSAIFQAAGVKFTAARQVTSSPSPRTSPRAAADLYGSVVMDYLNSLGGTVAGPYGDLMVTPAVLQCASDALLTLPDLTQNNAREEIYNHVMQSQYIKSDHSAIDVLQAALQAPAWTFGGAYVIETMLATELEMQTSMIFDPLAFNAWDLSGIDWSMEGNTATDLSAAYMDTLLAGYNGGNGVDATTLAAVQAQQPDIEQDASGKTECTSMAILQTTHWVCPEGHDPAVPGSAALGCDPTVANEDVCQVYGQEAWNWMSGLHGLWGYEWFQDNLATYGPPSLGGAHQSEILGGVAQAIAEMGSLSGGGGAAYAGDNFASGVSGWFAQNDGNNSAIVDELLNSGAFEGLDWLLTAGESMMTDFGGNSGGNGSMSDFAGGNAQQNGYWQLYDMIDMASNGGNWNWFGNEFNGGNASYSNASYSWWDEWVNSQMDWGPDSQSLWDKWSSFESYNNIKNGTKNIYGPAGPPGATGAPTGPVIITMETWEWPLAAECVTKTYSEDINEYLTEMGKSQDILDDVAQAWSEATFTMSCGSVAYGINSHMSNWMNEADPTGAKWAALQPCLLAPQFDSLVIRIEAQLTVAKQWDPAQGDAYEEIDWEWLTFDLTQEELTQEFIETGLETMEELQFLFDDDTIDPEEMALNLTELLGTAETTTAAAMTTTAGNPYAPNPSNSTGSPYNPGEDSTGGDPYAPPSDGYGDVYGDPHVKVKSQGQQAVCFDIVDLDETIFDFLSDPTIGLEVNGQIFTVGKRTRLEKIFIRSPIGVEVEITPSAVRVGFNTRILETFDFEENTDFGKDDLHLEVLSRSSSQRKNGVIVSIGHNIRFHVSIKNGKDSMRFEILESSGLSTTDLSGIIGQSILPHDYTIDQTGSIHIRNRIISNANVEWNEHDLCQKIANSEVSTFLGHEVAEYHVTQKFEIFKPTWQTANLVENASPK